MAVVATATWYGVVTLQARNASRSSPVADGNSHSAGQAAAPLTAAGDAAVPAAAPRQETPAIASPRRAAARPAIPESAQARPIATTGNTLPDLPPRSSPALLASGGVRSAGRAGGTYSVLVGSFRQDSEAAALVEQLRGLGYEARIDSVESEQRGAWQQVLVGPYTDITQAKQEEARVRQLPGYSDARLVSR
jgi:cell division septation protein DedD